MKYIHFQYVPNGKACYKDIMINVIMKRKASLKSPCLHPVFGPVFTPYPLFQWYLQSKDILLNLKMKCWNSAFNAQGSRLIIVVVHVGAVKIYVAAVEVLRKKEKNRMKLSLPSKLVEKLVEVPFTMFCFVKFSFSVTRLMACYAETSCFHPLIAKILLWSKCCKKKGHVKKALWSMYSKNKRHSKKTWQLKYSARKAKWMKKISQCSMGHSCWNFRNPVMRDKAYIECGDVKLPWHQHGGGAMPWMENGTVWQVEYTYCTTDS